MDQYLISSKSKVSLDNLTEQSQELLERSKELQERSKLQKKQSRQIIKQLELNENSQES